MAVPKRKKSRSNTRIRRSAWLSGVKVKKVALTECSQCHEMKLPHVVCGTCGSYAGRVAVEV